jgi:hypothetical protein
MSEARTIGYMGDAYFAMGRMGRFRNPGRVAVTKNQPGATISTPLK